MAVSIGRRDVLVGLGAWAVVAGCSGTRPLEQDINEAKAHWSANRPPKYRYALRMGGFMLENRYLVEVDVLADTKTVTVLEGTEPGDTSAWDSIDALFDTAIRIRTQGGKATITFDESGVTPSQVVTDPLPEAVDDEVTYFVSEFTVV
jgi:hypothetical protein